MTDNLMTPEEVKDALLKSIIPQIMTEKKDEMEMTAQEAEEDKVDFSSSAEVMWSAYTALRKVGFSDAQAFELTRSIFTIYIE